MGRQRELAGMVTSLEAFCQRLSSSLKEATFALKRQLVELLIDRAVVTRDEVEVRYVFPTSPKSEHTRFGHLRTDYLHGLPTWEITGEVPPLTLRAQEVKERVEDTAERVAAESPMRRPGRWRQSLPASDRSLG